MNLLPVIVSIIGDAKMNVGTVLSFAQDISKACEQLRAVIQEIEKPESMEQ